MCSPMPGNVGGGARPGDGTGAQERPDLLEVTPVGGLVGRHPTQLAVDRVVEDAAAELVAVERVDALGEHARAWCSATVHSTARRGRERLLEHTLRLARERVVGASRAAAA